MAVEALAFIVVVSTAVSYVAASQKINRVKEVQWLELKEPIHFRRLGPF